MLFLAFGSPKLSVEFILDWIITGERWLATGLWDFISEQWPWILGVLAFVGVFIAAGKRALK